MVVYFHTADNDAGELQLINMTKHVNTDNVCNLHLVS